MNKKILLAAYFMAVVLFLGSKAYADEHKYVGANKCKMCHSSDAKGNQYKIWSESAHAKAYRTLASDEAKEIAKRRVLSDEPQKSPECLKCHVTAFEASDDLKEYSFIAADGIQCESCHGPGSDYKALSVMKDEEKAIEAGLIIPTKEVCVKCHNMESPGFAGFDYDQAYKKIAHPLLDHEHHGHD